MPTTFPLMAAGWRAAIGWLPEAQYGFAPTGGNYNWVGAVQEIKATIDKQPLLVYRMDGQTDFPAYILEGQRNVELVITYWPQDISMLLDDINNIGTATVSHSFIIYNYDTQTSYTVTGCIANTVTVNGKTGEALEVKVDYWCQNIMLGFPSGVTFSNLPTDIGVVPFYFSEESVQIPSGTPKPQSLTFTGTITNNLQRVYQFGKDYVRTIPTLTRKAEGSLTATFDAFNTGTFDEGFRFLSNILPTAQSLGSNNETSYTDIETAASGLSQQEISLLLGANYPSNINTNIPTLYYLNFTGAVLPKIDLDTPIADKVALAINWTATGGNIGTTT